MSSSAEPGAAAQRASPLTESDGRLRLRVRVTPRSRHDCVDAMVDTPNGPAVGVRVRAVPENGAANAAVIATIARWIDRPPSSITLSSGGKSRYKTLDLGASDDKFAADLAAKLKNIT